MDFTLRLIFVVLCAMMAVYSLIFKRIYDVIVAMYNLLKQKEENGTNSQECK